MSDRVAKILELAETHRAPIVTEEVRGAFNALFREADGTDFERLAARAPQLTSAPGAGLLAAWLGAMVEGGADPAPMIPPLVETFLGFSAQLKAADEQESGDADPVLQFGLQELGRALVSMIAACDPARAELSHRVDLREALERISHISNGAMWLEALMAQESGELLVLHVESGEGALVRYRNIANAFHLFTLLQHELAGRVPGARPADPALIEAARGGEYSDKNDQAVWHFGLGSTPAPDIVASVWGEGPPSAVPMIDGVRVLLLWPMILGSRSWSGSFFGPALQQSPPSLEVLRGLSEEEAAQWRARLGLGAPETKPWWRPW